MYAERASHRFHTVRRAEKSPASIAEHPNRIPAVGFARLLIGNRRVFWNRLTQASAVFIPKWPAPMAEAAAHCQYLTSKESLERQLLV